MNESEARSERAMEIPAFLIAGTHSGVGKTTVVLGIMAALRARGLKVQPFKVGPDFIDPTHHTAVCGRPSRNLDPFMMGEEGVRRCFRSAVQGADVAVVEGVMGLFDGLDGSDLASSAHVARILDLPVLLVMNVHGMSRSAAALEMGFSSFDTGLNLAGSILNRVGSKRHLEMLKSSLSLPVFAALPRESEREMKSRHLGLVMGFEEKHDLASLAAWIESNSDLDRMCSLWSRTHSAPQECARPAQHGPQLQQEFHGLLGPHEQQGFQGQPEPKVRIGVALDEAFCFYYHDNLLELERSGAELFYFSPLRDELPDVDGLYIGGGYPELHAEALSAAPAREQIKRASEDEMPILGECGGLMYLGRELVLESGTHRMIGALPGITVMTKKLVALGYAKAEAVSLNPVVRPGAGLLGHEFHYSRFECEPDARFAYRMQRGKGIIEGRDGLYEHNTLGCYLHTHFYSVSLERFIELAGAYRRR